MRNFAEIIISPDSSSFRSDDGQIQDELRSVDEFDMKVNLFKTPNN